MPPKAPPAVPKPQPPAAAAAPPATTASFGEIDLPAPREKQSSLPAALGNLGDLDLPARTATKPATPAASRVAPPAKSPPAPEVRSTAAFGEIDLPSVSADLPAAKKNVRFDLDLPQRAVAPAKPRANAADDLELDLGPPAADLPAPLPDLPSLAASLPARKAEPAFGEIDLPSLDASLPQLASTLPTVAGTLPTVASTLPTVASSLPEVANVMPTVGQQLPQTVDAERHMPAPKLDFGEVDLGPLGDVNPAPLIMTPKPMAATLAAPLSPPQISSPPVKESSAFAELDLSGADLKSLPPSHPPPAPPVPEVRPPTNALTFGEVDLGGQTGGANEAPIATEAPMTSRPSASGDELALPEAPAARTSHAPGGGSEASLPMQTGLKRPVHEIPTEPSRAPRVIALLVVLLLIGGGALQATKHGAFGYLTIGDMLHAKDYASFTTSSSNAARLRIAKDVFPQTQGAVDDLVAAHWKMPRASGLTAYAAFAEFAYETRFGGDVQRNAKAKLFLGDLAAQPGAPYLGAALAAEDAASGALDKARKGLEAASKRDAGDPIQRDIALLRGEVELAARDPKAAKTAFDAAIKLGATAQAHYGLARAAKLVRDWPTVASECDLAIAATPHHPGALLLRAMERYDAKGDDTGALADLAEITEGPAKPLASTQEIAQAHANRGQIFLRSGRAGDARNAFDASLKIDGRNVDALMGQGTVFFEESRFTEALTRFDTALQARPDDEFAIGYDARTKIKLERLKDAKDQLVAAKTKFPKSMQITYALAQAESALGNSGDAEKDFRQAIDLADPKSPESVEPYIALATLLVAHNRDKDAEQVIDDAKAKLPDDAPVAVALGEYDAAQGKYDEAVARFKHALELAPTSLSTHFKLGVTYRHMRKTELATQEFNQVLSIDKDYPGLALERGLLFEESGEVERALEQFKNALASAPDDADLQLRVGAAYVAIGRPDDALPMLRKVLEKRATSAEANHYLGRAIFAKDGATNEAMRYLKHAVELDPNRPEYHLYVGWAANDANPAQLGLAQDEIQKALDLDKLLADAYWQRGELERKRLAVDDALKDLRRALELRPSRVDAYATMAECYEDKNDPATALANWQKAIAGNGHVPYWHYRFGKLLLDRNNAGEAAVHLSSAVEAALKQDVKPPWLPPAEFAAAEALNRTGKRADSITMYRRFLEIASSNDPDRRDAIKALANMGETYRPGGGGGDR
jgi:tetratricopeptide (TPR) repeat protein